MPGKENLHDYQKFAADFIVSHREAAILLDCGCGKTVITLTAIEELLRDSFEVRRVLVICPIRVAQVWADEIAKWSHLNGLRYSIAVGAASERRYAINQEADIYVINRDVVPWLVEEYGGSWKWDMLVLDELSSFKNHQAKRFKALMKVRPRMTRVVGLTGTPSSNGLMDLWAEYRLIDLGERLGRFILHQEQHTGLKPVNANIFSSALSLGSRTAGRPGIGKSYISDCSANERSSHSDSILASSNARSPRYRTVPRYLERALLWKWQSATGTLAPASASAL